MPINQSDISSISSIAKLALAEHLDQTGAILYSSHETICTGEVYFMGLNPGGEAGTGKRLQNSIDDLLKRTTNAYLVPWENDVNDHTGKGETPLQQRAQWLFLKLGLNLEKTLCTNLIFMQSKDEGGIRDKDYGIVCWPVHQALLSIVRPRLILAYGNSKFSAFEYLHKKYDGKRDTTSAGHGNWQLKAFKTEINGHDTSVVGLPHLSRYDPRSTERSERVINFIQKYR